uniref:Uncharacterized protein n=1 Tax=Kalanchoe fedtschenkoi TaxID=63787 RepID=A0A7N0VMB8_KALFE
MTVDDPHPPLQQRPVVVNQPQPHNQNLNFTEIRQQRPEPQITQTLTLDPRFDPPKEDNPISIDVQGEDLEEAEEESEPQIGMPLSPPSRAAKAASSRRGPKRKRMNRKQLEAVQHKVRILMGNLKLIPFVPNRAIDFASHESLLRRLGLWGFVHVELDSSDLRADLIAQLVVNYKKVATGRVSEVNGFRIRLSRADLGRALKLPPVKKEYNNVIAAADEDAEFVSEKSVRFVEELMSNWMLLHDEDTWILPEEVMHWIELIRKGRPDRVEWASLMWFMVEKELSQGIHLADCYYASHLQHLIKHQNERLFLAEPDEDVNVRDEEEEEDGGDVAIVEEGVKHVATAVREDGDAEKVASTVSKESDAEKMGVSVNEVFADEKISEELLSVKSVDSNNDTHMEESSDIKTGNSDNFRDLHKDCSEVKPEEPSVELSDIKTDKSDGFMDLHKDCSEVKPEEPSVELSDIKTDKSDGFMDLHNDCSEVNKPEEPSVELSDIKTDKSDGFMDLHNDCSEVRLEEPSVELSDIKTDKSDGFMDLHKDCSEIRPEEPSVELSDIKTEKSDGFMDLHNDCSEMKPEEPNVGLTLAQDNFEQDNIEKVNGQPDDVMIFEDLDLGDSDNWQLNEKSPEGEPYLRQCNLGTDKGLFDVEERVEDIIEEEEGKEEEGTEEEEDVEEDGEEEYRHYDDADEEGGIDITEKFDSLQGISEAHLFQGVNISQSAFGSPLPVINESPMQHFASHAETDSTASGNTLKRAANFEQNLPFRGVSDGNKRIRCDDTWDHQESSGFHRCMENIEHWMGKAKMMYAAKEQECTQMNMNQQHLYAEVEQRNRVVEHQEKITIEVRQKSQMEIYKLERELFIMGGLLDSYRKALKETRRQFSEYRARCSLSDEPLYKDAGPGGVVLSVAELERQRLKQELEDRTKQLELESTIKSFESKWYPVFEGHHNDVQKLSEKLLLIEEKVKLLRGSSLSLRAEEIAELPATTEEMMEQPAMAED